jgi:hypothetical protein
MNQINVPELPARLTKELLRRCSARELIVLCGEFGLIAIARRLGYQDVTQFLEEKSFSKKAGQ